MYWKAFILFFFINMCSSFAQTQLYPDSIAFFYSNDSSCQESTSNILNLIDANKQTVWKQSTLKTEKLNRIRFYFKSLKNDSVKLVFNNGNQRSIDEFRESKRCCEIRINNEKNVILEDSILSTSYSILPNKSNYIDINIFDLYEGKGALSISDIHFFLEKEYDNSSSQYFTLIRQREIHSGQYQESLNQKYITLQGEFESKDTTIYFTSRKAFLKEKLSIQFPSVQKWLTQNDLEGKESVFKRLSLNKEKKCDTNHVPIKYERKEHYVPFLSFGNLLLNPFYDRTKNNDTSFMFSYRYDQDVDLPSGYNWMNNNCFLHYDTTGKLSYCFNYEVYERYKDDIICYHLQSFKYDSNGILKSIHQISLGSSFTENEEYYHFVIEKKIAE